MILGADTFAGVEPSITGGCTLNTLRVLYKLQYNTYIYIYIYPASPVDYEGMVRLQSVKL